MRRRTKQLLLAAAMLTLTHSASSQANSQQTDPFQEKAPPIELRNQSVVDGVAQLSQATGLAYSVEFPLGATISAAAPQPKIITAQVQAGTIQQVLDLLCALDPTFTWKPSGTTANVIPSSTLSDATYLLNRRLDTLTFQRVTNAQDAVVYAVEQLPGPKEQIAILGSGISLDFAEPWTKSFTNVTVREVFNAIARQFGPTYGWQFGGAKDFRVITFHQRLAPKPDRTTSNPQPPGH